MRFGIFLVRQDQKLANMTVATIRHHHRDAEIVHLTDDETPQLACSDSVQRIVMDGYRLMRLRNEHFASIPGEIAYLDSDILVRQPLDDVFAQAFDVALTRRELPRIPYNLGGVFSRNPAFWSAVSDMMDNDHYFDGFM